MTKEAINIQEKAISQIFALINDVKGIDFSHYRQTTILRRLDRRRSICKQTSYSDYLELLQNHPEEIDSLYSDFLLFFTEFFRDPSVFDRLQEIVFPALVRNNAASSEIKIWVPGCSTGEEVYSLAIAFYEFLENTASKIRFRIFGTDLVTDHIAKARIGKFSKKIQQHISSERLERFFVPVKGGFKIAKHIREKCLFANQDVIKDPPFPNIDLISCRNVLIYFDQNFLEKVIPNFHFSLKNDGFLLLGTSENLGKFSSFFIPKDKKTNIFCKRHQELKKNYVFPDNASISKLNVYPSDIETMETKKPIIPDISSKVDRLLLDSYAPAAVLLDNTMQILEFRGQTALYLEPNAGIASLKLSKMLGSSLMPDVYMAIESAKTQQEEIKKENVSFIKDGTEKTIHIRVIPIDESQIDETCYLVVFEPSHAYWIPSESDAKDLELEEGSEADLEINRLKRELQTTKEHLRAIIEEKDHGNQNLWIANEEIRSTNEELQSVNEELEAAKEELEAGNEELVSLNEELHAKNNDLLTTSELNKAIINSTLDGILAYDRDFCITQWNKALESIFGLEASACLGKSIFEVLNFLNTPEEKKPFYAPFEGRAEVTENQAFHVQQNGKNGFYEARYSPLIDETGEISNGLAVIHDFTNIKKSEEQYRLLFENMTSGFALHEMIYDEFNHPVDYRFITVNPAFEKLTGISSEMIVGRTVTEVMPGTEKHWIENYGKVASTGESITYENYAKEIGKTFETLSFSPRKGQFAVVFNDISERKEAERHLMTSRERLNLALKASKSGIWDWNLKDNKVYFDDNYFIIAGYEPNEFPHAYEEFEKRVHPDDLPFAEKGVADYVSGEKLEYREEIRFQRKDGSWMWIQTIGKAFERDKDGKPVRFIGLHIDINENKKAEEQLRESEGRFRDLFNNMNNCVAVYKAIDDGNDFQFVDFNRPAEKLEGVSRKDLLGVPVTKAFPGVEELGLLDVFQRVWKTGHSEKHPVSVYQDGVEVSYRVNFVYKVPSGEIVAIYDDLTEQKRFESDLLKSNERFQVLFESNPAAIWLEDFSAIKAFFDDLKHQGVKSIDDYFEQHPEDVSKCASFIKVIDVNQATLHLHEAKTKEALFAGIEKTFTEASYEGFKKELIGLWNGEERIEIEGSIQTLNKTPKHVTIVLSIAPEYRDDWSQVILSMHDISEIKRVENELIKMQHIESIGTLAGGIAHDFNNILMGIYGNISMVKEELTKKHPAWEYLVSAEDSMSRAKNLTNQLMTFSKGGAPQKGEVSLTRLLEDVVRFDLTGSAVKPIFTYDQNLGAAVVDPGQMQQVFSNLTINAKQAMPDGGELRIAIENHEILDTSTLPLSPGNYLKVSIADEGSGIKKEHLKQIFDPYYSTKTTGSGLGLTTCYSIVSKHNGYLQVESKYGQGSTFYVYLPAHASSTSTTQFHEKNQGIIKKVSLKILIMDDEAMLRDLLTQMLTRQKHRVETAKDGTEAIQLYKDAISEGEPFDVLIMDLTIPGGMGGKDAIGEILKINPQAKAIVSSGYADDPVMAHFEDYGFKGRTVKPYNSKELEKALQEVL